MTEERVLSVSPNTRRTATALLSLLAVLAPGTAHGAMKTERVTVEDGTAISAEWASCESQSFSTVTRAVAGASLFPRQGEVIGDGAVQVLAASASAGRSTWTLAPTPEACSALTTRSWERPVVIDQALRTRFSIRRYVVRAGATSGTASVGGLQVNRWTQRAVPTIGRVRRAFGRPSDMKAGSGGERRVDCAFRWKSLGFSAMFVNYGGRNACKYGLLQQVIITNPQQWVVQVGSRPGVIETSTSAYLAARGRLPDEQSDTGSSLASVFIPWGEPGYYPSIVAQGKASGPFSRYDVWVGAGGD